MSPKPKREYEADIPILIGLGIAFLIFASISLIPPVSTWLHEFANWLSVLALLSFFPGIIMLAIAIGLSYQNKRLRRQVLKSIHSGDYGGRTKLDEIAADFDLSHGDIRRLLTDLRMEGVLKVSFDSRTGEIIFPTIGNLATAGASGTSNGHIYCSFCGVQLSKESQYCPSCGANLY